MTDLRASADIRVLCFAVFVAGLYLAVIIREFARLAACKLIGWDVYLLRIWPFLVRLKSFAVRLEGIPGKPSVGWVVAFPPTPEKQAKWRVAVFNASGAAANFICTIVIILVTLEISPSRSGEASFLLLAAAQGIVAIFSLNLFQKDEPLSHFGVAHLKALGLRVSGIMPGRFDSALVDALEAGADPGTVETDDNLSSADIFLYEHYFDLEKYEKAREALDRVISRTQISDRRWDGLWIENAFFSAFIERDIPVAEGSLAKLKDAKRRRYYPYRQALVAIAIARGDGGEALRLLQCKTRFRHLFSSEFDNRTHARVVREAQRLVSRG